MTQIDDKYIIALDLDGTLITGFDNYNEQCFSLLRELSKTNLVIIATGRPFRSSKPFYDSLNLATPIINYNGALVFNPKSEDFPRISISMNKKDICNIITNLDCIINIFCEIEDNIYLWKEQHEIDEYLHLKNSVLHIGDLNKILPGDPHSALVFIKKGFEEAFSKYINDNYSEIIGLRYWYDKEYSIAELFNIKTSKANALNAIKKYYNIPKERVIAIGDGHNDIEMLQEAGIPVAMENSHPELLKVIKTKTKSVNENGVYHFLNDFFKK